jgi:beta-glucanase (GH16 family)
MRELAMPSQSKSGLLLGVSVGAVLVASTTFLVARAVHVGAMANSASSNHPTQSPSPTQSPAPTHSASTGHSPGATSILSPTHGALTWNDQFTSAAGLKQWWFESGNCIGGSCGKHPLHELQWWDRRNATVRNGNLVLTATKGPDGNTCWYGPCQYASVRMQSTFSQAYGLFEARIKLAGGPGIWPAFWMQGVDYAKVGPPAGEIDIAEVNNQPPVDKLGGYSHAPNSVHAFYDTLSEPYYANYHIYAVEWTPRRITWFVDGKAYGYLRAYPGWPFNHPFNIILSLAVGGGWPGPPTAQTHFPVSMYVNWLRVYRLPPRPK